MHNIKYGMSFEYAFMVLVTDYWSHLPREFRQKYAVARSKHFNGPGIGDKMKRLMLE